jgi:hypothetical protein
MLAGVRDDDVMIGARRKARSSVSPAARTAAMGMHQRACECTWCKARPRPVADAALACRMCFDAAYGYLCLIHSGFTALC